MIGLIGLGLGAAVAAPPSGEDSGWTPPVHAVVNGEIAEAPTAVAALVAIDADGYGGVFCTATMITPRWALTAAHCVDAFEAELAGSDIYLFFNTDVMNEAPDGVAVARGERHPDWDRDNIRNDIALVETTFGRADVGRVVLNDEVVTDAWAGQDLLLMGYGVTRDGAQDAGLRRRTTLDVTGCMTPPSGLLTPCANAASTVLYAQRAGTNLCQGDSGGPAFEQVGDRLELVGVNSFVSPQCVGGGTGVTRVDRYIPWILSFAPDARVEASGDPDDPDDTGGPARPPEGAYRRPVFGLCASAAPAAPPAWAFLVGVLLWRRRR